jgi:hypothetical protein
MIDGDPVVCGGAHDNLDNNDCFLYQRDTKNWRKVKKVLNSKFVNFQQKWLYLLF